MAKLTIVKRDGERFTVEVQIGTSLMEAIRDSGTGELQAMCGGSCSCATCHIYVDESFQKRLPLISEDENDLLYSSEFREPNSRLSCQVRFDEVLNGVCVTIAPEG